MYDCNDSFTKTFRTLFIKTPVFKTKDPVCIETRLLFTVLDSGSLTLLRKLLPFSSCPMQRRELY